MKHRDPESSPATADLVEWLRTEVRRLKNTRGGVAMLARRAGVERNTIDSFLNGRQSPQMANFLLVLPHLPAWQDAMLRFMARRAAELEVMMLSRQHQEAYADLSRHAVDAAYEFGREHFDAAAVHLKAAYRTLNELSEVDELALFPHLWNKAELLQRYAHTQFNRGVLVDNGTELGAVRLFAELAQAVDPIEHPTRSWLLYDSLRMGVICLSVLHHMSSDVRKRTELAAKAYQQMENQVVPVFGRVVWQSDDQRDEEAVRFLAERGSVAVLVGKPDRARSYLEQATKRLNDGPRDWTPAWRARLEEIEGRVLLTEGRADEALAIVLQAVQVSNEGTVAGLRSRRGQVEVLLRLGRWKDAQRLAKRLLRVAHAHHLRTEELMVRAVLVRIANAKDDGSRGLTR